MPLKGISPAVNKIVNSKAGQAIKGTINNSDSLSKPVAEIRNSLNLGESNLDNVKSASEQRALPVWLVMNKTTQAKDPFIANEQDKYQTIDKHLQKISGSKVKQLPQKEVKTIIDAGKISSEEEKTLIDSWKNGNKQKDLQDKFDVIRDSKLTEKDLIDLGIITSEQAKNRLLQQHRAGKGIYYQQFSNHKLDGIDITRDYFSERNSKKGWFGQKIKEGITDKATVQDIVKNIKLRKIQASNIKEALNFIEKNFAQRIDEKGIKQGYVPVNKHLLANAMWGKTTKEWYKTLEQGEDAINKAFKNKKQAQGWIELHNRTKTHDFQIPEELFNTLFDGRGENLAEYWSRYENAFKGKTAKLAGTILDIGNNFFKRRVLGTSSFVLNNRMNQLMIAAKSDNPAAYLKSIFQAKNIKDIDLPSEILENSIAEAVENSIHRKTYTGTNQLDNLLNIFGGHVIDTKTLTGWKKLTAKTGNIVFGFPNKLYNSLANKLLDFNTKFETFERKQVFAQQLDKAKAEILQKTGQKMISMQEAIKYVHKHSEIKETIIRNIENTLGDYNNFNKFERDILKRIIPFYSWYRTILRHTIHLAKDNPSRCAMTS